MDWLQDKKNQPIVIAIFALVMVGAGFAIYMQNSAGKPGAAPAPVESTADMQPVADQQAPMPADGSGTGDPFAQAPAEGAPQADAGAASAPGTAVASLRPMESYREDPFRPIGWKKPSQTVRPIPPITDLPIPRLPRWQPEEEVKRPAPEPPQPTRRMSGLLLNGRVYAIIETNGRTEILQPGDRLRDGLATVDTIERDKVILKTTSETPRYIVVRMAAAPRTENPVSGPTVMPNTPNSIGPGGFPTAQPTPRGPAGVPIAPGAMPRGM